MIKRKKCFVLVLLVCCALPVGGAEVRVEFGDQNATITGVFEGFSHILPGDFNGDGTQDIFLVRLNFLGEPSDYFVDLILGGAFASSAPLSSRRNVKILMPPPSDDYQWSWGVADFNGDGRDDLFAYRKRSGILRCLFGRSSPPAVLDFAVPDVEIPLSPVYFPSLGRGDFNGDGAEDLLFGDYPGDPGGKPGAGVVTLLFGQPGLAPGVHRPGETLSHAVFYGKNAHDSLGLYVAGGRLTGGDADDLVLSSPGADPLGRSNVGEVYIFHGRSDWPAVWDLAVMSPDTTIMGSTEAVSLRCAEAVDVTGDGGDELILNGIVSVESDLRVYTWVTGGQALPAEIDLTSNPPKLLSSWEEAAMGDFDGDGAKDVVLFKADVRALLTTDHGTAWVLGANVPETSVRYAVVQQDTRVADVTGDGRDDILVLADVGGERQVQIVYGFQPLRDPSVSLETGPGPLPRVTVVSGVRGEPTEMVIIGDLVGPGVGKWIPYEERWLSALTPAEGPKTVRARYRNAALRVSEEVSAPFLLSVGETPVVAVNNRVRPGHPAAFDCHLSERVSLKVVVTDGSGRLVHEIRNGPAGPGIETIHWDGRSSSGGVVSPGVYQVVLEVNGRRERKSVLVR